MHRAKQSFKARTGKDYDTVSATHAVGIYDRGEEHGDKRFFIGTRLEWINL